MRQSFFSVRLRIYAKQIRMLGTWLLYTDHTR